MDIRRVEDEQNCPHCYLLRTRYTSFPWLHILKALLHIFTINLVINIIFTYGDEETPVPKDKKPITIIK